MKLVLEINKCYFTKEEMGIIANGHIMITPSVGKDDYWKYRVKLSETQAIIGFPKFGTIGIGFMDEKDWNTNLPYSCEAEQIYNHIKHNKQDKKIKKSDCIKAIQMIKDAVDADKK